MNVKKNYFASCSPTVSVHSYPKEKRMYRITKNYLNFNRSQIHMQVTMEKNKKHLPLKWGIKPPHDIQVIAPFCEVGNQFPSFHAQNANSINLEVMNSI